MPDRPDLLMFTVLVTAAMFRPLVPAAGVWGAPADVHNALDAHRWGVHACCYCCYVCNIVSLTIEKLRN